MSIGSERGLRKAMREKSFERVYYFVGDDDFLKERAARDLGSAVVDGGARDFNYDVLHGSEATGETIDTLVNTPPMMSDRRFVLIRDVHQLRRDAKQTLLSYLRNPSPGTVLAMVAPAGEKPEPDLVQSSTVIDFQRLDAERLSKWIAHYAKSELDAEISAPAAALLADATGSDLALLAAELDKLASYSGGRVIGEEDVAAIVGVRRGESLGDLVDAVLARDARRAAGLVQPVLLQTRTNAVQVIMALSTQLLAIAWGRAARDRGMSTSQVEREYFVLLRESRVFLGRPWGEAVSSWMRGVSRWNTDELDQAMRLLLAADMAAKEARVSTEEQLVASLVLSLCALESRRAA